MSSSGGGERDRIYDDLDVMAFLVWNCKMKARRSGDVKRVVLT